MNHDKSILLVDDIELFLELEQTFFHREGFDLLIAVNAQELMQLVVERKPELIFLDRQLAGVKGDDVCRWLRRDSELRSIPVIMLIDAGDSEAEALSLQAGCDAVIQRPVSRRQLLSLARTHLNLAAREALRISARLPVAFGPDPDNLRTNYSVNLSPGGVFIATDSVVPVGTSLALQLRFPAPQGDLSCQGQVAWLNPNQQRKKNRLPAGMGVRFNPLANADTVRVQTYLAAQ